MCDGAAPANDWVGKGDNEKGPHREPFSSRENQYLGHSLLKRLLPNSQIGGVFHPSLGVREDWRSN